MNKTGAVRPVHVRGLTCAIEAHCLDTSMLKSISDQVSIRLGVDLLVIVVGLKLASYLLLPLNYSFVSRSIVCNTIRTAPGAIPRDVT